MFRFLFICHGNICRSPMAQYLCDMEIKKRNLQAKIEVSSAALSREELGNGVYPPAKKILNALGINCNSHRARQITNQDFEDYDLLIVMDESNLRLIRNFKGFYSHQDKVYKLLSFAGEDRDIADPWYTGDFRQTKADLDKGLNALFDYLKEKQVV